MDVDWPGHVQLTLCVCVHIYIYVCYNIWMIMLGNSCSQPLVLKQHLLEYQ